MIPQIRWARSRGAALAYQVVGEGRRDILVLFAGPSHLEVFWDLPEHVDFIARLSELGRVILYDKRGVGLSDRTSDAFIPLEMYADDLVAVLDAAGSSRAVVFAWTYEGATALAAAARHPERISGIVAGELLAAFNPSDGHPWGYDRAGIDEAAAMAEGVEWGQAGYVARMAPDIADDPRLMSWWRRMERLSASPVAAAQWVRSVVRIDARPYLADVRAPVLLLHDADNAAVPLEGLRWLAGRLPNGKIEVVSGESSSPMIPGDAVLDEVEYFLEGTRSGSRGRTICLVLVSDIAGSTQQLAAAGGQSWRHQLEGHRASVRRALSRHQGREVDTAGDGFLCIFSLVSQGIACAVEMRADAHSQGLHLRIGMHAGEVVVAETGVTGLAVHVAARLAALAAPDEVLLTDTSAVMLLDQRRAPAFEPAGEHLLKGVPGSWRVHRLVG